jgi:hypothetical protein
MGIKFLILICFLSANVFANFESDFEKLKLKVQEADTTKDMRDAGDNLISYCESEVKKTIEKIKKKHNSIEILNEKYNAFYNMYLELQKKLTEKSNAGTAAAVEDRIAKAKICKLYFEILVSLED